MFELNRNLKVIVNRIYDTPIFIIDKFYKYPDEVYNYLFNRDNIPLWKVNESPTNNGIYFEDRRLVEYDERLEDVYNFLSDLCEQPYFDCEITTNMTRFAKHSFNDYENCIWWPHSDTGYNGIVYFNDTCGTNLYEDLGIDGDSIEHYEPWRWKENYKLLMTIEPKYNRMVLFDGVIPHGMNITNDYYFDREYRENQVFFFDEQ